MNVKKIERRVLRLTAVLLFFASFGCDIGFSPPEPDEILDEVSDPSYTRFGINGGYLPGTIVAIDENGHLSSAILSRDFLLKALKEVNGDSTYLDYEKKSTSNYKYYSKQTFIRNAKASVLYNTIGISAQDKISQVQSVDLEVKDGYRIFFKNGGKSSIDFTLRQLTLDHLLKIRATFAAFQNLYVISETMSYGSGTLKAVWGNQLKGGVQVEIKSLFDIGGSTNFVDSTTLEIQYNDSVLVEFKAYPLGTTLDDLICENTLGAWTVTDMLDGRGGQQITDPRKRVKRFSHTFESKGVLRVDISIDKENQSGELKIFHDDVLFDHKVIERKNNNSMPAYIGRYEASQNETWRVEFATHMGNTLNPSYLTAEVASYGCSEN